jgi:hypothetical protein
MKIELHINRGSEYVHLSAQEGNPPVASAARVWASFSRLTNKPSGSFKPARHARHRCTCVGMLYKRRSEYYEQAQTKLRYSLACLTCKLQSRLALWPRRAKLVASTT